METCILESPPLSFLIIDDTCAIQKQLKSALQHNEYKTLHAQNGTIALKTIQEQEADIILIDVVMLDLDGINCIRCIRQNPAHKDIRVILVADDNNYLGISQAYAAGCNDYITKPINSPKIVQKLYKIMRFCRLVKKTQSSPPTHFLTR